MNHYALTAQNHWQETDPERVAEIDDPDAFFEDLGRQILTQVVNLADQIVAREPAATDYPQRLEQLNTARRTAEEIVFADLVWIAPPEEDEEPDRQEVAQAFAQLEDEQENYSTDDYEERKAELEALLAKSRD